MFTMWSQIGKYVSFRSDTTLCPSAIAVSEKKIFMEPEHVFSLLIRQRVFGIIVFRLISNNKSSTYDFI